jgi:hypothetical protein
VTLILMRGSRFRSTFRHFHPLFGVQQPATGFHDLNFSEYCSLPIPVWKQSCRWTGSCSPFAPISELISRGVQERSRERSMEAIRGRK